MANWQLPSFTFNTKRLSNKTRCDVLVKQMFHLDKNVAALWLWLNSSKSDDLRINAFSTSTKCKKSRKNTFFICWSPLSRHYKKWE